MKGSEKHPVLNDVNYKWAKCLKLDTVDIVKHIVKFLYLYCSIFADMALGQADVLLFDRLQPPCYADLL